MNSYGKEHLFQLLIDVLHDSLRVGRGDVCRILFFFAALSLDFTPILYKRYTLRV